MRTRFIKKIYCVVIVFLVSLKNVAAHVLDVDTTKLIASLAFKNKASELNISESKNHIEVSNVKYPESLQNERDQSLEYIKKFSDKKRDYLLNIYQQGQKYFPKIVAILKQYQLPEELKVLMALESGFNANAVSKVGAVGYWQIMSAVAKEYGLHISSSKKTHLGSKLKKKDDRKNFDKSTLFAAKYFRDSQSDLNNDLLLMVASYNCGTGRVLNAIKRSGNPDARFWDIKKYLPAETRKYVMNFIALSVIFENFEKFSNNQLVFLPLTNETTATDCPVYETTVEETAPAVE